MNHICFVQVEIICLKMNLSVIFNLRSDIIVILPSLLSPAAKTKNIVYIICTISDVNGRCILSFSLSENVQAISSLTSREVIFECRKVFIINSKLYMFMLIMCKCTCFKNVQGQDILLTQCLSTTCYGKLTKC